MPTFMTPEESDALWLAPGISTIVIGVSFLAVWIWQWVSKESPFKSRLGRFMFTFGWILTGFGIAWLILSQIKTCGDPRGTVTVDAPVAQDGEHLVFELRRLPYHEKDDSATRAIPDDADNDEGPSGTLYYYANASSEPVAIPVKKIELKGRTNDPRLKDSYAFDIKSGNSEEIGFPDAGECGDYVLRGGDNDFAHYGDVLAAFSNNRFIPEFEGTTGATIMPRPVHVYFKDMGSEAKLEYEGVSLLVPKWHNYECMYQTFEENHFDPGENEFEKLVLEQTTRKDKRVSSLFGDDYYAIRSRSEDFNRASMDAVEKDSAAAAMVEAIDKCFEQPYTAVDHTSLARLVAFNQLVPSYDMYASSVYTVFGKVEVEGSGDANVDEEIRCFYGVIWDREISAGRNKKFPYEGWAKPTGTMNNLDKSLVWQKVEYMLSQNPTQDGTTFLDKVKAASDLVKRAHEETIAWIKQHETVLKSDELRWQLPGNQCGPSIDQSTNPDWGAGEDNVPQIYTEMFEDRYEWLMNAADFTERVNVEYINTYTVFTAPEGALGWVISSSILLGALLITEVMIMTNANMVQGLQADDDETTTLIGQGTKA